jgi:phosphoribosylamine--glycine ligase
VIEEFLDGEEASFIVMVDGKNVLHWPPARTTSASSTATRAQHRRHGRLLPGPVRHPGSARQGHARNHPADRARHGGRWHPFTGFLYAGLMIGKDGSVKTLEFNCRMGDPETQPILMRLKSDFVDLLEHGIDGTLDQVEAEWDRRIALGVVLAAANYPDTRRRATSSAACPRPTASAMTATFSTPAPPTRTARW